MANNKMWAVCKDDNECVVMCKNYSDWYCVNGEEYINSFFKKHEACLSNKGCGENILFVTEVGDDRVLLIDFTALHQGGGVRIYLKGDEDKIPK